MNGNLTNEPLMQKTHFSSGKLKIVSISLCLIFLTFSQFVHAQCLVDGGIISTTGNRFTCAGDGEADMVDATVSENIGESNQWVITDETGNILSLPPMPPFDFEGAGAGKCYIYNLSYDGDVSGLGTGMNINGLEGCFDFSNRVSVVRRGVSGGEITTSDPTSFCVGDGEPDLVTATVSDWEGNYHVWIVTDADGNMLAFPKKFPINFDGAGVGVCQIWHVAYTFGLKGIGIGNNIFDLQGCHSLSNPIAVSRNEGTLCDINGGVISTNDPTTICAGDGVADPIDVALVGAEGSNMGWIITSSTGEILALPAGPPFDLDGAGSGVCNIYHVSYEDGLTGLMVGSSIDDLEGTFALSNSIAVTRNTSEGGELIALTGEKINRVVIVNRASSNISVINSDDNSVEMEIDMPDGGEPMYAVHNSENNTVIVGDYNGQVAIFDGLDFSVKGTVEAADGVFHMWLSPDNQQLWVNNELDKSISVIDPNSMTNLTTFSIPQDLLDDGYKPHDVIVMPDNSAAFVTMLGTGDVDYVVKYNATTFEEMDRVEVGSDPHVSLTSANDKLYVASQGSSELVVLLRSDLSEVATLSIPNAHGLGMNTDGTYLYIGNISDGGTNATYTLDLATNTLVGDAVDAPFSGPHNYAITSENQLFITHSGATNNTVSVYSLSPTPSLITSVVVGSNPFGLVAYSQEGTTDELTICAGDGVEDPFDVALEGADGANQAWVITDANGNILGLPASPPFDLEGAGAGACLVWNLSYADGLTGLSMGENTEDLEGCFSFSNPITVFRNEPTPGLSGGAISTNSATSICAGDGSPDFIFANLTDEVGPNSQWVITDSERNILALPMAPPFNLEGAGAGTCLIYHVSYDDGLTGLEVGQNLGDLDGCFSTSNSIAVEREGVNGGMLTFSNGMESYTICAGDGVPDPLDVEISGTEGLSQSWIVTDEDFMILSVPAAPPFDLEGAGEGVCLIWGISHNGPVEGLEMGSNALELEGCLALSNAISVTRITVADSLAGGVISTTDSTTICAGDGVGDPIDVILTDELGPNSGWIITDSDLNILGLPAGPPFDLDGAGGGVCLIWHISSVDGLRGVIVGANLANIQGCFELSNSIAVTRNAVNGGSLSLLSGSQDTSICVGDGMADPLDVVVAGSEGADAQWIITDQAGEILGLPAGPPFDLDDAGVGTCLIWYARSNGALEGLDIGLNAMDILGCFDLSNPISVRRDTMGGACDEMIQSPVLELTTRSTRLTAELFPNPATNELNIRIDSKIEKSFDISIIDVSGKVIDVSTIDQLLKGELIKKDISSLQNGYYFIRITSEESVQVLPFIKG